MTAPVSARVRCGDDVHRVAVRRGALVLEDHPDVGAERMLVALGGQLPECVTVLDTWRRGTIRALPAALRATAVEVAGVARGRWSRRQLVAGEEVSGAEPSMRVRRLIEREASGLVVESVRAAGTRGRVRTFVGLARTRRWPHIWYGWAGRDEGRLSVSLPLDWCSRVHEAGLGLVDDRLVVERVDDDLVLAVQWHRARTGRREPKVTLARVVEGGTRLVFTPFTLRSRSFVGSDGQRVHGAGFEARRDKVVKVAGVSFRADALQSASVRPFRTLSLVPEPDNPADPCAVGVWDASREVQVGYVPRDESTWLSPALARGETWHAVSAWEWWRDNGRRLGLRMMLVPGDGGAPYAWTHAGD